jgi:8-oxo-dGTP pyrophosphatase MutT (NUDIX family)
VPNEFSAGAVVLRRLRGRWWLAAIRPGGKPEGTWALPKGNVARGDSPANTALREVEEETGLGGELVGKLGDVKYFYVRKDGARVFKVVSFFLVRYRRGRIGDIPPEHAHEVDEARWLPLEDAPRLLAYKGEREMAGRALQALQDETPAREAV